MSDQYPQARHVLSNKGTRIAGIPFLNVPQMQAIVLCLAFGYSTGWWSISLGIGLIATIGLATYQREFIAVRIWAMLACWAGSRWGRPSSVHFGHQTEIRSE